MMINSLARVGRAPEAIKYFNSSIFLRAFSLEQVDIAICIEMVVTRGLMYRLIQDHTVKKINYDYVSFLDEIWKCNTLSPLSNTSSVVYSLQFVAVSLCGRFLSIIKLFNKKLNTLNKN